MRRYGLKLSTSRPLLACLNQSHLLPGSLLLLVKVSHCNDTSQGDYVSNFEASLVLLAVVVLFRRLGHFGNLEKEERFSGIYFWITSSVFVNSNLALFPRHRNYLFEQNILEKKFQNWIPLFIEWKSIKIRIGHPFYRKKTHYLQSTIIFLEEKSCCKCW